MSNKGGRPALQQGERRKPVTLSLTQQHVQKLRKISKNKPSAWLRAVIESGEIVSADGPMYESEVLDSILGAA